METNRKYTMTGYSYLKEGGFLYKRTCRDYYMYDPLFLKYNDKSLFKNIGFLFHIAGHILMFVLVFLISMFNFGKGFWASLGIAFLAYLIAAVLIACEDFVGEIACKLQGLFTGVAIGYLIQEIAFKCSNFAELYASEYFLKMLGIYAGLCLAGYICMSSFWKSGVWNLINPSHPCSFLNKNLQKLRKSYIDKTEAKLTATVK